MKIILVRHCESNKNIGNKFDSADTPDELTQDGQKQLKVTLNFLRQRYGKFRQQITLSGPRQRSLLTAEPLSTYLSIPLLVEQDLVPINPGVLTGLSDEEAWLMYPDLMSRRIDFKEGLISGYDIVFPYGDSLKNYESKIRTLLLSIELRYSDQDCIFIVAHQSIIVSSLNIYSKLFLGLDDLGYFSYFATPLGCIDEITRTGASTGSILRLGGFSDWSTSSESY